MAEPSNVVAHLDAYRARTAVVRAEILRRVGLLWDASPGVDDATMASFVRQVVPQVQAGQLALSSLTDAYLALITADVLGEDPTPAGVLPDAVDYRTLRRGMPPEVVYMRPFITARAQLSEGQPYEVARSTAAARLDGTVQTDLALAERQTAFEVVRNDDRITGFRRVLRSAGSKTGSCGLCLAAASHRYGKEDLLPIHDRCHCGVMPIFGHRDEALAINKARYDEAVRAAKEARPEDQRGSPTKSQLSHVRIHDHGEKGPTLTKAGDHFTGPHDVPDLSKRRERIEIQDRVPETVSTVADTPRVMSVSEARAWGQEHFERVKTLPAPEREALKRYAGGSYSNVNKRLRGQGVGTSNARQVDLDVAELDKILARNVVPEDVVVSRAVGLDTFGGVTPDKMVGKVLQDKGFLSTSVGEKVRGVPARAPVHIRIEVPKGTHGYFMRDVSQFKEENELLLARGQRLAITGATYRGGKWHVTAKIVKGR